MVFHRLNERYNLLNLGLFEYGFSFFTFRLTRLKGVAKNFRVDRLYQASLYMSTL